MYRAIVDKSVLHEEVAPNVIEEILVYARANGIEALPHMKRLPPQFSKMLTVGKLLERTDQDLTRAIEAAFGEAVLKKKENKFSIADVTRPLRYLRA